MSLILEKHRRLHRRARLIESVVNMKARIAKWELLTDAQKALFSEVPKSCRLDIAAKAKEIRAIEEEIATAEAITFEPWSGE